MIWDIGIDLGTANVRMATVKNGIAVNEPCAVALRDDGTALYFGQTAYNLIGREPEGIRTVMPLRDGTPENLTCVEKLIRYLTKKLDGEKKRRHSLLVTYAPGTRAAYSEALMNAALDGGVNDVALVRSDIAGAIGSGVDVFAPEACLIIDLGAGKISASLLSMGREVACERLPYGLGAINARLIDAMKRETGFWIGYQTAEDIKVSLASAGTNDMPGVKTKAYGYDAEKRTPRVAEIRPEAVNRILSEPLNELIDMCRRVISDAPEELSADLNDTGAIITGGGAALYGVDKLIGDNLHIPCTIADQPSLCAIKGVMSMLLEGERYSPFIDRRMAIAQRR